MFKGINLQTISREQIRRGRLASERVRAYRVQRDLSAVDVAGMLTAATGGMESFTVDDIIEWEREGFPLAQIEIVERAFGLKKGSLTSSLRKRLNSIEIGARLRRAREDAGKSQRQVAELICESPKTIDQYETGQVVLDVHTLIAYAEAVGTTVAYLVGETKNAKT